MFLNNLIYHQPNFKISCPRLLTHCMLSTNLHSTLPSNIALLVSSLPSTTFLFGLCKPVPKRWVRINAFLSNDEEQRLKLITPFHAYSVQKVKPGWIPDTEWELAEKKVQKIGRIVE